MEAETHQPEGVRMAAGADLAAGVMVTARSAGRRRPPVYAESAWPRSAAGRPVSEMPADSGLETVGVLPVGQALTVWLEAPFASPAKARRVFPSLLDIQLPFPIEQCVYGFFEVPARPGGGRRALAVAARLETVAARLQAYRAAGLDPIRLDYEGLALWTQALDECGTPAGWRAVLHLETGRAALAIGEGVRFQNAHALRLPEGAGAADALAAGLASLLPVEMPAGERLEWVLVGPAAEDSGWAAALAGATAHVAPEPARFLARALAARAVRPGPLRCNLRVGELAHPAAVRRAGASRRRTWQALAAAALAVCALAGVWPAWCGARLAQLDREIAARARLLAPGATLPRGQEIREVEAYQAALEPFLQAWTGSLLPELGLAVQTAAASGVKLGVLRLQRGELALEGRAEPWRQAETLAEGVRALGWTVELQRGSATSAGGSAFTLKGRRAP
jgi:hypothetical protein